MNLLLKQVSMLVVCTLPLTGSTIVYSEDFSSTGLPNSTQSTLGHYAPFVSFGVIGVAANVNEASIQNGALQLSSSSGFRGIGVALDGASLSTGSYTLSFDISSFGLSASSTQTIEDYFEAS